MKISHAIKVRKYTKNIVKMLLHENEDAQLMGKNCLNKWMNWSQKN